MGMDCITMVRHTRTENYLPKEAAPKTPNSRWRINQEIVITECKVHHCSQMDQQKAPAKAGASNYLVKGSELTVLRSGSLSPHGLRHSRVQKQLPSQGR